MKNHNNNNETTGGFDERTLAQLKKELPPVFGRQTVARLFPGIVSPKTLANMASRGEGPRYRIFRRNAVYSREDFLTWFSEQIRD